MSNYPTSISSHYVSPLHWLLSQAPNNHTRHPPLPKCTHIHLHTTHTHAHTHTYAHHTHTLPDSLDRFKYLENSPRTVLCHYNTRVERGNTDLNFFPREEWPLYPKLWSHFMKFKIVIWQKEFSEKESTCMCVCVFIEEMMGHNCPITLPRYNLEWSLPWSTCIVFPPCIPYWWMKKSTFIINDIPSVFLLFFPH